MKNLNLAGYWFNPRNLILNNETHRKSTSSLLDVIEKYADNNQALNQKLTREMALFRNSEGDFGRKYANLDRAVTQPDEWWRTYGNSAPTLQKLAIRVLSQTCSSSGCERNWSIFEHLHSKKRNRLEHQRLNDLIYVHYNLRLQQRFAFKGRNYDPIGFDEEFKSNAAWVLEDEPPTSTNEELEAFRRELAECSIPCNQNQDEPLNVDDLNDDDGDNIESGASDDQFGGNEDRGASYIDLFS